MRWNTLIAALVVALAHQLQGAVALAQQLPDTGDQPRTVTNWMAPPHWAPPATHQEGPTLRPVVEILAKNVPVKADSLTPSPEYPFTPITPCRLVDTRSDGTGAYADNGGAGETRTYHFDTTVPYTGTGACSLIPAAAALSLSIQFQVADHNASLIAYPDDVTRPLVASVVAYNTGLFYMNSVIAPTGVDGGLKVFAQYGGQVVININGYYAPLLPYSGSASSAVDTDIFTIQNTGSGRAMHAIAGAGTAGYFSGFKGIEAYGSNMGGYFKDSDGSGKAYVGYGDYGIQAFGNIVGGYFEDADSSGFAWVGHGEYGIQGYGNEAGGYFKDNNSSGLAYVGYGDIGIDARGNTAGGYFKDSDSSGVAYVGYGDIGIDARGNTAGGSFVDSNSSGFANVAVGDTGIEAYGNFVGGHFGDNDSSGYAYVGYGDYGIQAYGNTSGGYFKDADNSGHADVGNGDAGIDARGNEVGGYFEDSDGSGFAWVGYGDTGIEAYGNRAGGYFNDLNSSNYAFVAYDIYKIFGSGLMSFAQNHPFDPSAVIVYAAPEGDEVATYTRGSARLQNGEARVPLGETFKWVTNPDLGLTAHLTPHGEAVPLAVVSLTTEELHVRGPENAPEGLVFDYIVYGLRVGFEESTVVQEKRHESYIPSMKDQRERVAQRPELARYTALSRFSREREALGLKAPLDLSRAAALKAAIHEFDPKVDRIAESRGIGRRREERAPVAAGETQGTSTTGSVLTGQSPVGVAVRPLAPIMENQDVWARSFRPSSGELASLVEVAEDVEAGDVLVIDRERAGAMRRSRLAEDRAVAGVVATQPGVVLGSRPPSGNEAASQGQAKVAVVFSGVAECRADASFGAIAPGDLLVSSPTPGHAMRSDAPLPGAVVGKALEPLPHGQGLIKVLVTLR